MKVAKLPLPFLVKMADVIKMIGHPQRLQILEHLDLHGACMVADIVEAVGGQQGAISQHLNKMRRVGIIDCQREGKKVFYRIAAVNAVTILNCLRKNCASLKTPSP
jgi:DNA-binding transcriptional ArsR family regulator